MTTPALLCDTGALLDYLSAGAPDHAAFRDAIDSARARAAGGGKSDVARRRRR